MRETLTLFAFLLVVALAAALAGPYFIDWTQYRGAFEARLGEALGRPIQLRGAIDLKLLPSPRLELGPFALVDAPGQPAVSGQGLRVELAAMPLLSGEFRFIEAFVDHPEIRLTVQEGGGVDLPDIGGARPMRFEHVALSHAVFILQDRAGRMLQRFADLDLVGQANALNGPYVGSGQFATRRGPARFRFATGAVEQGCLRLKATLEAMGAAPRVDLDGALSFSGAGPRKMVFDGAASLLGALSAPTAADPKAGLSWRLSGLVHGDAAQAKATGVELRLGEDDTAFAASGEGEVVFGDRPVTRLSLSARAVDLDRLPALADIAANWLGEPWPAERTPTALNLDVSAPLVTWGGQTLTDASLAIGVEDAMPIALRLSVNGPGRSAIALDGALETGAAAGFKGQAKVATQDLPRLVEYLGAAAPGLAGLPAHVVEAAGEAQISRIGFSVNNLSLKLDRSTFAGAMAYTSAVWTEKARLFADLTSDALDLDAAPDIRGALAAAGDTDLAITLDARAIKVARFGDRLIDAGRIGFKLVKTGAQARLENFSLANLGGANVAATGAFDGAAGHVEAHIDAARLVDAAELLRHVAPGPASALLARRAGALSPANLTLSADVATRGGALALSAFSAQGSAGGTRVQAQGRPDDKDPSAFVGALTLDAPNAASLTRQLGVEAAVGDARSGGGRLTLNLRGAPGGWMDARLDATLAGARLAFAGPARFGAEGISASGAVKGEGEDATPLLALLGVSAPEFPGGLPAKLDAKLQWAPERIDLSQISGQFAGAAVEGAASLALTGSNAKIGGAFKIDRLSLSPLVALALGPAPAAPAGALWPDRAFARGLSGAPAADVQLDIAAFDLWPGFAPQPAALRLELGPGLTALRDLKLRLAGGRAGGELILRRDRTDASLQASLAFTGVNIATQALGGTASGQIEATATGRTALALAAGVAGSGQALMSSLALPHSDPNAIGRVLALVDKGGFTVEEGEVRRALERELDLRPMILGDQTLDVTMAAGVARVSARELGGRLRAALDLRNFALDQRLTLRETVAPKEWSGDLPQIDVILRGPLAAPAREIEAASFTNGLAAREITREAARIEALEADIRERAAFNRRIKGLRKLRQDEIDYQRWQAEEARKAAEAEALRQLDQAEAQRRAAATAAEAARRAAEAEAQRQAEAARLAAEAAARAQEEARQAAEAEALRAADEAEAQRRIRAIAAEAARHAAELEAQRRAEAEAQRKQEEAAKAAAAEARRKAEEAQRLEEARLAAEAAARAQEEARQAAEAEALRAADEAEAQRRIRAVAAEAARHAAELEAQRRAEAEAQRKQEEAAKAAAAEARRKAEEAQRLEEARRAAEADVRRKFEEAQRAAAIEAQRKADAAREAAEAKRLADEQAKRAEKDKINQLVEEILRSRPAPATLAPRKPPTSEASSPLSP